MSSSHLKVARQAQAILEQNNPAALQAAIDQLATLKADYPSLTGDEGYLPFTECSLFADNIKGMGYSWQSSWHYIDIPQYSEGGKPSDYSWTPAATDLTQAMDALYGMMTNTGNYQSTTYYQQIAASFPNPADQLSFALRLMIHYVGDVHQPLHAETLVNSQYPNGDAGGNYERVPNVDGVSNLHSVWDSVIYEYPGYPVMPIGTADWDFYTTETTALNQAYPVDSTSILPLDWNVWANQSFDLAVQYAYPGFVSGQIPSSQYQATAMPIVKSNIMLGAARLANLIEAIYAP